MPRRRLRASTAQPLRFDYLGADDRYNAMSHPMAFQKASAVFAAKGGKKERPDVEDAFEDSDEGEAVEDTAPVDEDEEDISKDKMIKAKKAKKEPGGKKAAAPKAAPKKGKK